MQTRSDMEVELLARLRVAGNSTVFTADRLTQLIANAYIWCTEQYVFHELVKAKITSTIINQQYYDYPIEFRTDSIVSVIVGGVAYLRKNFFDFLSFQRDSQISSGVYLYADYMRQFHIYPIPVASGSLDMTVYGAVQADALTNPDTTTIFTDQNASGNEAIVEKAFSVAVSTSTATRYSANLADIHEKKAMSILTSIFKKQNQQTQKDQKMMPMYDVPDMFGSMGSTQNLGSFNYPY